MCEVLKKRGFTTAAETHWAWVNGAEDTFKAMLTEAKVDLGTAPNALQSIPAGKLRRLRSECKALCKVPDGHHPSGLRRACSVYSAVYL